MIIASTEREIVPRQIYHAPGFSSILTICTSVCVFGKEAVGGSMIYTYYHRIRDTLARRTIENGPR